jgi:putative transposase
MPRKGHSNEVIVHAVHPVEGGEKVAEVCRRLGVSEQTFYRWKKQFAGLGLSEIRELRSLRHENAKNARSGWRPHVQRLRSGLDSVPPRLQLGLGRIDGPELVVDSPGEPQPYLFSQRWIVMTSRFG